MRITDLPGDIYDHISLFLSDKDLSRFLSASPQITVSAYVQRDRQRRRAYWKRCGAEKLAVKGDLQGLQYLHGIGTRVKKSEAMNKAATHGRVGVVEFMTVPMIGAAKNGHLAVVEFLYSIGASCTDNVMDWAAWHGHLAIVQYLHRVGAQANKERAILWAAARGHLAVVQFLHGIGAFYNPNQVMDVAVQSGHLAVVQFISTVVMMQLQR